MKKIMLIHENILFPYTVLQNGIWVQTFSEAIVMFGEKRHGWKT